MRGPGMHAAMVLIALTAAGWSGLLWLPGHAGLPSTCGDMSLIWNWGRTPVLDASLWMSVVAWHALMLLAMMSPGLHGPVAHLIRQSLPRRTPWLLAVFVVAYLCAWLPAAMALLAFAGELHAMSKDASGAPLAAVVCWYAWCCTPLHQAALNRCHAMSPVRSFGGAAVMDAAAFGCRQGRWCVLGCWPLMLMPMLAPVGQGGAWMVACTAFGALLRQLPPQLARWRGSGFLPMWKAAVVAGYWCAHRVMPSRRV